ncbi:MAG: sulfatase-like hydrolase/transferase [Rikenellaceae bacterium]
MNKTLLIGAAASAAILSTSCAENQPTKCGEKPNVIVVLLDDLGSNDVGFRGSVDIITPNIDRIANEGANCTDAYISAPYSGPSRCGLMTGRYQQRFGAEANADSDQAALDMKQGVLESEVLLGELLKENGYKTAAIGKWHLGDHPDLWPQNRGFDYFYGFSGGGHNFWGGAKNLEKNPSAFVQENGRMIPASETTYLTDDFSNKAVEFIDKSAKDGDPFFVYLAYNAPHAPLQAPQKYLDRTEHIYNQYRSVYAAMILAVDDGVGEIWEALERHGIEDNTMIIFLSDNGGVGINGQTSNLPHRSFKGNMFDGGIHTPFAFYWKGAIHPGTVYDKTISSLDIYATVATAAGVDVSKVKNPLDGVDLIPYLSGKDKGNPHTTLFWRVIGGKEYAVRKGDYKLVKTYYDDNLQLYNVKEDMIERVNIAAANPDIVKDMAADYKAWNAQLMTPRWADAHEKHQHIDHEEWAKYRKKASGGR